MAVVELSWVGLLREITSQIGMEMPVCEVTVDAERRYVAYMDLHVRKEGETTAEVVRCWGSPSPTSDGAERDAARVAVHRLKDRLGLEIKDVNYEDLIFYKSAYAQLTAKHAALYEKYKKLKWEYQLLKNAYDSLIAHKDEYAADRVRIREALEECRAIFNDF
ncbi:uncharacterized protein LOC109716696 [Ananas comosus]|uniref:Uncharacterized protein LOC109716696 n=1 Tax=Ananas comosus TaxID=4615 RepID=A0A6P5FNE3_ANACO|nr:uncharacterized protein LOC109716696 [Ananas comosus]